MYINKKSRGDPTRTGDHLVPNQVRYQLRYTPMCLALCLTHCKGNFFFLFMQAKRKIFSKKVSIQQHHTCR